MKDTKTKAYWQKKLEKRGESLASHRAAGGVITHKTVDALIQREEKRALTLLLWGLNPSVKRGLKKR